MYSRDEAKRLKEQFWTTFGQYMSVVLSADNERVNWVNYKTGVKHLSFKMDVDSKNAVIMIDISHPDDGIRQLMFKQFEELKVVLTESLGEEWEWDEVYYLANDKATSRISMTLPKKNVFNQEHWPELITFFKSRIIALDDFWSMAQYSFDIFK